MYQLRALVTSSGFAAVAVALATVLSQFEQPGKSPVLSLLCFALAVLLSGAIDGLAAGSMALLFSLIAGAVFLGPAYGGESTALLAHTGVFLLLSLSILYIIVMNRSLQERAAHALKALSRKELELRTIIDAMPVGIWFTDREGKIVNANKAGKKIWGGIRYIGPEEYNVYKFIDPKTREPLAPERLPIAIALAGESVNEQECDIEAFDGRQRKLLVSTMPLRSGRDGEMWGTISVTEDITERVQAIEELRRAKEEAERANRAKDRFLAVLSHELRTPLTPVLMLAESLEKHPDMPPALQADARMMRRYVLLEARLIDDLLDLTRIEKGKLHLDRQAVDLNGLLHSVVEMVEGEAKRKGIGLSTNFLAKRHFIDADRARMKQIIWNILGNALKFTPPGGGVALVTEDVGNDVRVIVSDTGIGVPTEALKTIFGAFEQANPEHRRFGGLGLGLAISKSLLDLHGGQISAQSHGAGKGAVFTLTLPATLKADIAQAPTKTSLPTTGQLRILLVEDHEPTAFVLTKLLKRRGHDVRMAATVHEAYSFDEGPLDLLVSDIGLPDGSGLEVVQHYRARQTPKTPFRAIALSGFGMDNDIEKSLHAGFDRHLTKPVDFETLQSAIAELF